MTPLDEARDRAVGALLGLAIGDAIGTTLEFCERDKRPLLEDMVGGGPFGLEPGQWTDDTAMALCLADSLMAEGGLNQIDLMQRFCRWWRNGENSCTGECFDIGITTRQALAKFQNTGDPIAGSTDPWSAGNGSLMRIASVAIYWHGHRARALEAARAQSVTTHGAPAAVEACAFFTDMLLDAIQGQPKIEILRCRPWPADPAVDLVANGSWQRKSRAQIKSSGYVVHTLEAALWSISRASSFQEAVLTAANLADDADTVAAVTGQLAGALWGADAIPPEWKVRLAWAERVRRIATRLFENSPQCA